MLNKYTMKIHFLLYLLLAFFEQKNSRKGPYCAILDFINEWICTYEEEKTEKMKERKKLLFTSCQAKIASCMGSFKESFSLVMHKTKPSLRVRICFCGRHWRCFIVFDFCYSVNLVKLRNKHNMTYILGWRELLAAHYI